MIVTKGISFARILKWSGKSMIKLIVIMTVVALMYQFEIIKFHIPWLPISVIGTAVAFYVGFKNNQAYDRMWEARKIWGGIVNDSRSWGMLVGSFISNQFTENKISEDELQSIKKRLMYRHMGWIYTHREQLLIPTSWEHASQRGMTKMTADYYRKNYGLGLLEEQTGQIALSDFLSQEEVDRLKKHKNTATHIINEQSKDLAKLKEVGLLDNFRHMELSKILKEFYNHQGKNERIKKFPLPRQYANISRYFVFIFVALLPFSMIPELMKVGSWGLWLSIPITALIGWVYVMMEMVGDSSENPFQGMADDIPMLSL